jgi:hypothetical protein
MNEGIIKHYIAQLAQMCGFLDEKKYRDICIREEFAQIRNEEKLTVEKTEIKLAEKYSVQPETIHKIIYLK